MIISTTGGIFDPVLSIRNDLEKELLATKEEPTNCYIHPKNKIKIAWDIYATILLILVCIITPLNLAFNPDERPT